MNLKNKIAPACMKLQQENPLLSQTNLTQQWKFTIRIWSALFNQ